MNRIKWAEKKAYSLLENFCINTYPIPIENIAEQLKIKIHKEPFENGNLSGFIFRDDVDTIIGVNDLHPPTRQRFTIAHEIGHFIMHEGNQVHIDENFRINFRDNNSTLGTNMNEIEANAFAAALLMPEDMIRQAFARLKDGIDVAHDSEDEVSGLADEFIVSHQALLIRLGKLGLLF